MENKRKLNVVFANNVIDNPVLEYLSSIYDIIVIEDYKKNDRKKTPLPDLIIFTGGEDVDPSMYFENKGMYTVCNTTRDIVEKDTFHFQRSMNGKIPKLGICRGAQLLTVLSGGKLIQHVVNHKNSDHTIELVNGNHLVIPSDHHQMMYPYDMNKKNYEIIGYSERFMSNVYLDGQNKNIKLPPNFLEPEIVYYKNTNSFCIQPHPEWDKNSISSQYLLKQIDFYLFSDKNKKINEPQQINKFETEEFETEEFNKF